MKATNAIAISASIILSSLVLAGAYKYKFQEQHNVVVTGLAEKNFVSDLIVWRGSVYVNTPSITEGYAQLEKYKLEVQKFIENKGIPAEDIVFMFVNTYENSEPTYSQDGRYTGSRFTGYTLRQEFTVESSDVVTVENCSREISSLLAQGIKLESYQPDYYYSKLDDLKLELIEQATADAKARATKITSEAGSKLRRLKNARMGVFQITGANTNEEFSAGGNFNTSSKDKKARITMRLEYSIK